MLMLIESEGLENFIKEKINFIFTNVNRSNSYEVEDAAEQIVLLEEILTYIEKNKFYE